MACWTILKKKKCLGIVNACRVHPGVALHLKKIADYRLPTFGSHGTRLRLSWLQWIIKSDFLDGLKILKKETCLGIVNACGFDPAVTLHLRNTTDYPLPTFGPHGTKLGHSWLQWIMKSDFSGWFDNSRKGEVSRQIELMGGWSRGCPPTKECCRLPPISFWTTWHQTRAFSIAVKNKNLINGLLDNSEKEDVSGHCERLQGWSRGYTPPQEYCQLPLTCFWTTWHQTRAFLISVKNIKWIFWLVWQF
jgi:hypothetical protein